MKSFGNFRNVPFRSYLSDPKTASLNITQLFGVLLSFVLVFEILGAFVWTAEAQVQNRPSVELTSDNNNGTARAGEEITITGIARLWDGSTHVPAVNRSVSASILVRPQGQDIGFEDGQAKLIDPTGQRTMLPSGHIILVTDTNGNFSFKLQLGDKSGDYMVEILIQQLIGNVYQQGKIAFRVNAIAPPSVTLTPTSATLDAGGSTVIDITFSESVTGFIASDITTSAGTLSAFSGSGTTYQVTLTAPSSGNGGTITVSVPAGVVIEGNSPGSTTVRWNPPPPVATS
ncbi:MAG: Ig-like domain-containing protein, partial [Candidatus Poribacteria bacterium]|nr:Ig-like domain-containing protein [Candidatus Poribacteria bacterium]